VRAARLACAAPLLAVAAGCGGAHHAAPVRPRVTTRTRAGTTTARPRPAPPRALALPPELPARTVRVPILMYHRIGPLRPSLPAITRGLTVSPQDFAAQMAWLHAHGFHAIRQEQLYAALFHGAPLPPKPVLITFDDGYRDVLWNASPVLERLHMRATAYVITDRISGPDPSFLTWGELRVLEQRGIEIGSHTVHHLDLAALSAANVHAELVESRRALEQHLGHPVQWFAYPMGREDPLVVELARQAGYILAVTTQPGTDQQAQEPLLLHRYEILDTTGVAGLAALLR
jgi:peptidoglycan/xylan/chitin deacetylase (PgdA/CDA1 family)